MFNNCCAHIGADVNKLNMDRTAGIPLTIPEGCDELLTANAHNFLTNIPKRIKLTTPIGNAMSLTFQPGAQSD